MRKSLLTGKTASLAAVDLGLDAAGTRVSVEHLNLVLADQHVLYQKTRQMHWNLVGRRFSTLHKLFEDQYEMLAMRIDETAERIRMLGSPTAGAMSDFAAAARLEELGPQLFDGDKALSLLLADHDAIARSLRGSIGEMGKDFGTADFLTALLREHEKVAWILRSHREPD